MSYTIKNLSRSELEIHITVEPEEMQKHYDKACEEVSKEVSIKGFRPGHIPKEVLLQNIGEKHIIMHAREIAIEKSYAEVIMKEQLQVVGHPKLKFEGEEAEGKPFTFTVVVATMPEPTIKDYKSIKVEKKKPEVTEKEIEEVVKDLQRYATTYKEVDRPAQNKDRVELDFEGFDHEDKAVPNTKSANHPVVLGDGVLIPGFEDHVVGLKKGEKKEFELTFPKEYHKKEFEGKKMKFKVEVKMVEEPSAAELSEEFLEKMTGKKQNLDEFKKDIEKNILARKEEEFGRERENKYLEELLKRTSVDIPDSLIDEEAEYIIDEIKEELEMKKLKFEHFLEHNKTTEEELKKKYRSEAEKRIKVRLALQQLIKEEKLDVTDEELKTELEKLKTMYPKDQHAKIDEEYEKGHLKAQFKNRLLLSKLFEKVLA